MTVTMILIFLVLAAGFYMSWNIGANDVSNAMGTSVGSGALTLRRAVIIAAILEFTGAFTLGANVSETLQKGIIDMQLFAHDPTSLLIGMFSALVATSIWLQISSFMGWPVSTTHAIVGAILGFGIIVGGPSVVHWGEVGSITLSWIISPCLSGLVAYLIFCAIQRKVLYAFHPIEATKKLIPYLTFIVLLSFCIATGFSGIKNLHFEFPFYALLLLSLLIATVGGIVAHFLIKHANIETALPSLSLKNIHQLYSLNKAIKHLGRLKFTSSGHIQAEVVASLNHLETLAKELEPKKIISDSPSEYQVVEKMFSYLQIVSACFVAFAHGANDVANAIGPVASAVDIIRNPGNFNATTPIPLWLLALGGLGIVIGLATWGWRVIETIGKKITELTPTRGFSAEFGAALTILIASKCGLPVSTTHCIVGAVLGIGLAKGISALNLRMIKDIILSWVITIPSSALSCIILYKCIKLLIGKVQLL